MCYIGSHTAQQEGWLRAVLVIKALLKPKLREKTCLSKPFKQGCLPDTRRLLGRIVETWIIRVLQ